MSNAEQNHQVPWKFYLITVVESFLAFSIATFSIAMFFLHQGFESITTSIFIAVLYLFVIIVCIKRIIEKLPMAVLMLLAPTLPLFVLILILSLIPVLEKLR